MTAVAVLGSGRVGTVLEEGLRAGGHELVNLDHAEVVVNATPGESSVEFLRGLAPRLAGRVLWDVANATEREPDGLPGALRYPGGSLAEEIQAAVPEARVVKALNTMMFTVMAAPRSLSGPASVFVSGDDEDARTLVTGLLHDLGWPPEWVVDLGGLHTARATEALALLTTPVLRRFGFAPFAVTLTR
ncbi:putative dinucleotide-binding enzyme [Crossiella equi]|uniref:Dinucleotide-binding enzyme n=1 Tax=Crossiella equi TaxID=130796 RepID=A0ABS5A404_9PSEU|nr:NADP oxidoreductase [Crossiella equi]MBP2471307.1 putative dinucleotide-binding enzyme [Crossiella equi]